MKLMVLSGPKVLPHPALCQKRCASCFCFPRKKTFFYEKNIFRILHYSTALQESSPIMKIINFHWILSKIMKIASFEWPQSAPTPGTMPETMCVVFLFPKKKNIFLWKNVFSHFALLYGDAQSRARSSKSSIFMKKHGFHWFSLILVKNHENWWFSMLLDVPRIRY